MIGSSTIPSVGAEAGRATVDDAQRQRGPSGVLGQAGLSRPGTTLAARSVAAGRWLFDCIADQLSKGETSCCPLPGCETGNIRATARGAHKRPLANGPASARGRKRWKTAACSAATSKPIWSATSPALRTLTDPNLNGWGMASMPDGSFVVANTFTTGLATFYSSSGHVLPQTITVPGSASPVLDPASGSAGRPPHRRRLQSDE